VWAKWLSTSALEFELLAAALLVVGLVGIELRLARVDLGNAHGTDGGNVGVESGEGLDVCEGAMVGVGALDKVGGDVEGVGDFGGILGLGSVVQEPSEAELLDLVRAVVVVRAVGVLGVRAVDGHHRLGSDVG
jgi:hypothetical protein